MNMTEGLENAARELENRVLPQIERSGAKLAELNQHITTYIRANPGRCLLGAIAAGYVFGRVARLK